ncbi:MAG: DUF1385 domain-containing protein [Chloroflexota bacterium]
MSEPHHYGGQAVIEGVMMRGRQAMAVAVRHPSGEVVVHSEPLNRGFYRSPWAKRPFLRGALLLWDTLALGMRALMYSANVAMEEVEEEDDEPGQGDGSPGARAPRPREDGAEATPANAPRSASEQSAAAAKEAFGGGVMWGMMTMSLVFGIGIFFVSPLLLTRIVDPWLPSAALSVVVEGLIRIALFFGYVWVIGRLPDVRRVFAYHGAEHKAINAYEAGEPLRPERVERYSVAHPRCGTSFLLVVVVLSIFVFGLLGRPSLPTRIASRIVLVPVIASVAYEFIRFAARRHGNPAVRFLLAPGMALQALTTREPDTSQVEVAIVALNRVLEMDGIVVSTSAAPAPAAATAPG